KPEVAEARRGLLEQLDRGLVAVARPPGKAHERLALHRGRRRPRMALGVRQLVEAHRHCARLTELAELDERLDENRRDREGARLVDASTLRVLPHLAQARYRRGRVVGEQSGGAARS